MQSLWFNLWRLHLRVGAFEFPLFHFIIRLAECHCVSLSCLSFLLSSVKRFLLIVYYDAFLSNLSHVQSLYKWLLVL
jgi:hypothetical protein